MKTLTIKEPYTSQISNGIKKIETRSWKTNYRGYLYIYAKNIQNAKDNKTNSGKLICKCKLIDCIYMYQEFIDNLKKSNPSEYKYGKYEVGRYAWILDDIK